MSSSLITCPSCSGQFARESSDTGPSVTCPHCSQRFVIVEMDKAPDAPPKSSSAAKQCPFCGTWLPMTVGACRGCGRKLELESKAPAEMQQEYKNLRKRRIVCSSLALLFLIPAVLCSFFLVAGAKKHEPRRRIAPQISQATNEDSGSLPVGAVCLMIPALAFGALARGRSAAFGSLGLLSIVGLIIFLFVRDELNPKLKALRAQLQSQGVRV